jgi:hypothetical protein
MIANRIKQRRVRITILMGMTAAALYAAHARRMQAAARPTTDLTEQKITERAVSICRLFNGNSGSLYQTTDRLMRIDAQGRRHPTYAVNYDNERGQLIIHTVWDAETGQLLVAAHYFQNRTTGNPKSQHGDRPAQAAWRWLERLGVSSLASRWYIDAPPTLYTSPWSKVITQVVVLECDRYRATVYLDRNTEDLIWISVVTKGAESPSF